MPEPRRWTIYTCECGHRREVMPRSPARCSRCGGYASDEVEVVEARPGGEPSEVALEERLRAAESQVGYALVAVREATPREADRAISLALENLARAVDAVSGKEGKPDVS